MPEKVVEPLEGKRIKAIETAKGTYHRDVFLVGIKILTPKVCEMVLVPIGPKSLVGVAVVDGVSGRIVPTAKLGRKGKRSVNPTNVHNEIDGMKRAASKVL